MIADTEEKLIFNILLRLNEKELTDKEYRDLISRYKSLTKKSDREIAKMFNLSHTTLYYRMNPQKKKNQVMKFNTYLDNLYRDVKGYRVMIDDHKIKIDCNTQEKVIKIIEELDLIKLKCMIIKC